MKQNFDYAFDLVMQSEGGYVNDPSDHGGETNLGVTKAAWAAYLGRPIQDGEMKALTQEMVKPFYKKMYWDKLRGDELPGGVDYAAFDFGVNAGVGQAAKFIQRTAGVTADGAIGPGTMAAVAKMDPVVLLSGFTRQKEDFYNSIIERNPTQEKFRKGWFARVAIVQAKASSMLA